MQCPKCGTENRVGVKFCKKCGSNMIGFVNDTQELPIYKKSKKWLLFIFVILIVIVILASIIYFAVLGESNGNIIFISDDDSSNISAFSIDTTNEVKDMMKTKNQQNSKNMMILKLIFTS